MPHNLLLSPEPNHRWSPRHLQAMSYLYGLHTPDSDKAKVLELGCGMGANLLPFALSYPNGHATGIDIDENKITTGQQHLDTHHIKNISLYSADIATLLESELEQYDYILIRGLFAQTDLTTRTALLSWCQKHLSPTGIICIGYHTYPGSKITDSLYEALAFHAAQSDHPEEQVTGIKAMLGFMSEGLSPNNPLHHQIKPALEILTDQSDEQLYIETLGGLHNPCYFIEFTNSLAETGLCYVGDADAHTEIPAHWGDETERLIQVVNPQKNKIIGQQYLDLLCGRATRLSILTHINHINQIEFEPNTNKLNKLRWSCYTKRKEITNNSISNAFFQKNDHVITTKNPISQEIFDSLGWAWPFSLDCTTLLHCTLQDENIINISEESKKKFRHALEKIFIQVGDIIYYSLHHTPFDLDKSPSLTSPHKKKLEINGKIINLWHDSHQQKNQESKEYFIKNGFISGNKKSWIKHYLESQNDKIMDNIISILNLSFPDFKKNKSNKNKPEALKHHQKYIDDIQNNSLENLDDIIRAIKIDPYEITYYKNLCSGIHTLINFKNKSYPLAKRIDLITPNDPYIYNILGIHFREIDKINKSILFHEKSRKIDKHIYNNTSNLASCYLSIGDVENSMELYEEVIEKDKNSFQLYSNYLFALIHTIYYDTKKIIEKHKEYGYRVEKWAKEQDWTPSYKVESKKIRLGFSSGDLRNHAVTKFLLPYIENIDKNKFELYFYHNHKLEDHISERIKKTSDKWLNVSSLSHLDLAKTINSDSINILIDLSGHTAYNRLPVFALKPAPIQISWIGYPATTGLSTIDYYLTYNDYLELEKLQEQFTEQLLYLDIDFPFESTLALPEIASIAPARKNNYFTFASFNRTQKISNTVLKTWAEIMSHCPNDKLLIANIPDEETSQLMKDKLISYGVQEDQLIFKNRVGLEEYLQLHNEVDLLLDTFPYAGGTTAFHAISMGLPAIHLAGNSIYNYQSLYPRYGLHDFMASNIDNYKAKALLWRTQLDELQNLRHSLRNKLNQSTKETDHPVRVFERAMEYAWKNYLDGNSAKSAVIK